MAIEAAKPASRVSIVGAMRQAGVAGLLAFGLFLPLIGFNTVQNIRNELVLETRWSLLATFVGIVAAGRFLHALLLVPWLARRALRHPHTPAPKPASADRALDCSVHARLCGGVSTTRVVAGRFSGCGEMDR